MSCTKDVATSDFPHSLTRESQKKVNNLKGVSFSHLSLILILLLLCLQDALTGVDHHHLEELAMKYIPRLKKDVEWVGGCPEKLNGWVARKAKVDHRQILVKNVHGAPSRVAPRVAPDIKVVKHSGREGAQICPEVWSFTAPSPTLVFL